MSAASSWRVRFAVPLAAASGYLVAVAASLFAVAALQGERGALAAERFGNALVEQLAAGAEEPLLRQDRVALGVAAKRAVAAAHVTQVAVFTMDGRPFVVVGEPAGPGGRTYVQPVTVADEVTAEVRLTLAADAFATPLGRVLAIAAPFWAAGFALMCLAAFFGGRVLAWWRGTAGDAAEERVAVAATADRPERLD